MRVRIKHGIGWNRGMEGQVFRVISEEEFSKYMDFKCPTYFLPVQHQDNTRGNVRTVKRTNVEIIEEESGLEKFTGNKIVQHPKGTFIKVCRAPKVGDQILIVDGNLASFEKYREGDILTITETDSESETGIVYCKEVATSGNWRGQIDGHEYVVVEPFAEGPDIEHSYQYLEKLGKAAGLMPSEIILAIRTIMEVYNKTEPQVKLVDPIPKESLRDVTVKNAIKYIEDAKCSGSDGVDSWEYRLFPEKEEGQQGTAYNAEFIINEKKRTVVCLLRGYYSKQVIGRAKAKAAESDCFNVHIGKAIALAKALGWTVPQEFIWPPSPSGFQVGDKVKYHREDQSVYTLLSEVGDKEHSYGDSEGKFLGQFPKKPFKVVDDSARYPQ